jgi:signal transduction histidine kinase
LAEVISLNPKDWLLLGFVVLSFLLILGMAYQENRYNQLKVEYATYQKEQSEAYAEAQRRATETLQEQIRDKERVEVAYSNSMRSQSDRLASALRRVREYEASGARKPAEAAPAECGTYDASPAQLSIEDREFLVRLGSEADGLALKVNALQDYIKELSK